MKEIKAFIQPFMLHRVLDALHQIEGVPAVTISEVRGASLKRHEYSQVVRSRLEIMVAEDLVDKVLCAIETHAHTGKPGGAPFGSVAHLRDAHRNHRRHLHRRKELKTWRMNKGDKPCDIR